MRAEAHKEIAIAISFAGFKGQVAGAARDDQAENANRRALRVERLLRDCVLQEVGQLHDGFVRDGWMRGGPGDRDKREGGESVLERKHEGDRAMSRRALPLVDNRL